MSNLRKHHQKKLERAERLQKERRFEEAEKIWREYLAVNPLDPEVCFNMGVLSQTKANTKESRNEAVEWYHRAIICPSIDLPLKSDAMNNIGILMEKVDRPDKAQQCYFFALQFFPDNVAARLNYANGLRFSGEYEEADKQYQEVMKATPDSPELNMNAGMLALLLGDLERGFRLYERRFEVKEFPTKAFQSERPKWSGEELQGKTILIVAEQGFGDAFHFIRYAKPLKALGARVLFFGHEALIEVIKCADGVDDAFAVSDSEPFDFWISLMSLPHMFGTTLETIPSCNAYIYPPTGETLDRPHSVLCMAGIVWAGSPRHGKDAWRSIPPESFQTLINSRDDTQFYSFQCGPRAHEVQSLSDIIDLSPRITTWMQTAQLLKEMDFVITVDTAVAHLAGALGVPAWILIPYSPDFRWLLGRTDSPWYPNARLFRQPKQDDWQTPINEIIKELSK